MGGEQVAKPSNQAAFLTSSLDASSPRRMASAKAETLTVIFDLSFDHYLAQRDPLDPPVTGESRWTSWTLGSGAVELDGLQQSPDPKFVPATTFTIR